jgi:hypothetical protein
VLLTRRIRIILTAAAAVLLLWRPVGASALKSDLAVYLEHIRSLYPEACVTGSFYDWRSVSMYRAHAGLHAGYDIALNHGRQVPAGWSGTVVAITPWTDAQYGISVDIGGGMEVTYGHLSPLVHVGEFVSPGTFVGVTLIDHVDIKCRKDGGFLDFGQTYGMLAAGGNWRPGAGMGLLPPPPGEGGSSVSGMSLEAMYARYKDVRMQYAVRKAECDQLNELCGSLNRFIDSEGAGLPLQEQQVLEYYRAADAGKITQAQAEAQATVVRVRRQRVNHLVYVLEERQRILREKQAEMQSAQAASEQLHTALTGASADAGRIAQIESDAQNAAERHVAANSHKTSVAARESEAHNRMLSYQQLYNQGGVSRSALDEATRDYERLHLVEALYEQGDPDAARRLNW